MSKTTVKSVDYFYPTSTNAKKFGFPDGGYSVGLTILDSDKKTATTKEHSGYATKDEAISAASKMSFDWASWSKRATCSDRFKHLHCHMETMKPATLSCAHFVSVSILTI